MDIWVTVMGPGECFSFELQTIQRALEAIGCSVRVVDEYPSEFSYEQLQERWNKLTPKREIILKASHQPWGG